MAAGCQAWILPSQSQDVDREICPVDFSKTNCSLFKPVVSANSAGKHSVDDDVYMHAQGKPF